MIVFRFRDLVAAANWLVNSFALRMARSLAALVLPVLPQATHKSGPLRPSPAATGLAWHYGSPILHCGIHQQCGLNRRERRTGRCGGRGSGVAKMHLPTWPTRPLTLRLFCGPVRRMAVESQSPCPHLPHPSPRPRTATCRGPSRLSRRVGAQRRTAERTVREAGGPEEWNENNPLLSIHRGSSTAVWRSQWRPPCVRAGLDVGTRAAVGRRA